MITEHPKLTLACYIQDAAETVKDFKILSCIPLLGYDTACIMNGSLSSDFAVQFVMEHWTAEVGVYVCVAGVLIPTGTTALP
jgi:hypothetical protein